MIESFIGETKEGVDENVKVFLRNKKAEWESRDMSDDFSVFINRVEDFILRGGKRLRPALFCMGYDLWGDDRGREEVVRISMLVEFLHAYLLIHDDIIDQDDIRHGGPSLHSSYRQDYLDKFDGNKARHLGFSMAINIGDIISSWVYEIAASADFDENRKNLLVKKISEVAEMTLLGQIMDLTLGIGDDISLEEISKVQEYKTARYTVEGPLQMGAILAGADEEKLRFISDFAVPLGIAYQIQDDILGVFGDEEKIGKPVGSDIREGKKTLLVLHTLEKAGEEDKKLLLEKLGNKDIKDEDIKRIREMMIATGALDDSKKRILELENDFVSRVEAGILEENKKDKLKEFGSYILGRDR